MEKSSLNLGSYTCCRWVIAYESSFGTFAPLYVMLTDPSSLVRVWLVKSSSDIISVRVLPGFQRAYWVAYPDDHSSYLCHQ